MNTIRRRTKCTMEEYLTDMCMTMEEYRQSLPVPNIDILAHMNMGSYELWKACYRRYKIDTVDGIPITYMNHTRRLASIMTMIIAQAISRNYYKSDDSTSPNQIRDLSYMYELIHEYLVKETASRDDVVVGCTYDFEEVLADISGAMYMEDTPTALYTHNGVIYLLVDEMFNSCMQFGVYNKIGIMAIIDMTLAVVMVTDTLVIYHPLAIYRYVRKQFRKWCSEYIDGLY